MAEYQRVLELIPAVLRARLALAETLWQTERKDESLTQVRDALRLAPDYAPAKQLVASLGYGP